MIQPAEYLFQVIDPATGGQQPFGAALATHRVNAAAHGGPERVSQVAFAGLARGATPENSRQQDFRQRFQDDGRSLRQHIGDTGNDLTISHRDSAAQPRKGMEVSADSGDGRLDSQTVKDPLE